MAWKITTPDGHTRTALGIVSTVTEHQDGTFSVGPLLQLLLPGGGVDYLGATEFTAEWESPEVSRALPVVIGGRLSAEPPDTLDPEGTP